MTGKTVKQMYRDEFWQALTAYRDALATGRDLVVASIRIHAAKGNVPKSYWPLVGRTFRDTKRER